MERIRFQGKEYLLIYGAIATEEQYENFKPSYAHLYSNGEILRWGEKIGTIKDITFLDEEEE